ncbi:GntR family transcriptional regulator [Halopseudomonas phragmitis]|uniref:GntR family transcriptional regulator n=2 Tax=Pseudomonadaceae TaxID=135621 RepID=A0A1V0B672_9GAMM|nr:MULTISPECIES: GntR family transcriptional regulator [Pseudomonadaceae]AQZ95426.1 GntR family transcriptional regulator [Halopseudomonas phragmitis]RHW22478.1 GntR family transcriptional regulator [Pseudomonas jilinensis]
MAEADTQSPALTLSDGAFARIQSAIVKGEIAPGTRISEQYLSSTFGIGRGPLREAIRRLEGRRLVVRIPHAGVRVVSLSYAELIELYHVREALEGMACRLAAQNMSDEEIAGLREVLATHEKHSGLKANESYYQQEGDLDIHYRIIQGSKNQTLSDMLCGDLYHLVRMYRYRYSTTPKRPQQAFAEHHRIIEAIADRDGELAEMLMRRHISASRRNIERRMQQQDAPQDPQEGLNDE